MMERLTDSKEYARRLFENELAKNNPAFLLDSTGFAKVFTSNPSIEVNDIDNMYQQIQAENEFNTLEFNAAVLSQEYIERFGNNEYISSSYWDMAYKNEYKVVALRAPMGVGKSVSVKVWLKKFLIENPTANVVILTGRITNVENYDTQEYADMGFFNQHGKTAAKLSKDTATVRYVGVINSLAKMAGFTSLLGRKEKLIVIYDEFETILGQNFGSANNTDKSTPVLIDLIKRADFQVLADAFLSDGALDMFLAANPNFTSKNVLKNTAKLERWQDINVNLIEDYFSYSSKVRMTFNAIFRSLIEGTPRGCMLYFNLKENLIRFMDLVENQLNPQDKNTDLRGIISGTPVISQAQKTEMASVGVVFKLLFYYSETPVSGKSKQVGRVVAIDFASGKISSKNLNTTQMYEFKRQPNEFIAENNISVLGHSPILEAGISLDKLPHFESVIAWVKPSPRSSGGDGGLQALGRARQAREWSIYFEQLKDLKELRVYPAFPIKTPDEHTQEIRNNGDRAKEVIGKKLLNTLQQNPLIIPMYSRYLTHSDKLHALYIPKLVNELADMKGGLDKLNIYRSTSSALPINLKKKSIDATIERLCSKVDTLYTKEQVDEIKANINLNLDGGCTLDWFDRDVYEASRLVSIVSTSQDYNEYIRYGQDENNNPLLGTWQEIRAMDGGKKAAELLTDLHCLRAIKYNRDNVITINETEGLSEKLGNLSALKASCIVNNDVYLKSQIQDVIEQALRYKRNVLAVNWLMERAGIDKIPTHSTIALEIDSKVRRAEHNEECDPITYSIKDIKHLAKGFKCEPEKVTAVFNSTLERLGYESVLDKHPESLKPVGEKRDSRIYKLAINPLIHKYNVMYDKQAVLERTAKEGSIAYDKLLKSLHVAA